MPNVKTYDGRTVSIIDPKFMFPLDFIGIVRGLLLNYHGGVDFGWRASLGGPNHKLLTIGKSNKVRAIYNDGGWNGGYGNYITLDCDGFVVLYAHCLRNSFKVKVGDVLPQGVEIARMNNSGNSFGDHLHFEIYLPGSTASKDRFDPMPILYVYDGQIVSDNSDLKGQIQYLNGTVETVKMNIGKPTSRNPLKDQIEIPEGINARSNPNLGSTVLGTWNPGLYDVIETKDMRDEESNKYLWYRTEYGWCAQVGGVRMFVTPDREIITEAIALINKGLELLKVLQ